jgi:hypothetical protein
MYIDICIFSILKMRLNKLLGINFNLIRNQAPYRNTNYLFYVRPVYQKHIRKYSNENENSRPFALFEKRQPYSLPNPFKVLLQNLSLRWEMARIDGAFSLVDFYRGSQMVMICNLFKNIFKIHSQKF